jgi:hypothetical protein
LIQEKILEHLFNSGNFYFINKNLFPIIYEKDFESSGQIDPLQSAIGSAD